MFLKEYKVDIIIKYLNSSTNEYKFVIKYLSQIIILELVDYLFCLKNLMSF